MATSDDHEGSREGSLSEGKVPPERWIVELPFDSADFLDRHRPRRVHPTNRLPADDQQRSD